MLKAKTKQVEYGGAKALLLPSKIKQDSMFPYTETELEDLIIEIRGEELIIRKPSKGEHTE